MEYSDHDFVSCFTGSGWRIHDPFSFHDGVYLLPGKELGLAAAVVSALASLSPTLGPTLGLDH